MLTKHITIENKRAIYNEIDGNIVCGNSSYVAEFDFDEEWNEYETKKARFIIYSGGSYQKIDIEFSGNRCPIPAVYNTPYVKIGVFVEDSISTTTAAIIKTDASILCGKARNMLSVEEIAKANDALFMLTSVVPKMSVIDANRIKVYEEDGGYYFSENNWKSFVGDEKSDKFGYNRVYVERSQNRGTYGMYALSYNAEPIYNAWYSKAEWADKFAKAHPNEPFREPRDDEYPLLDSVVQRQNNGQIVVPTRPLEGWHATSKLYIDGLMDKLMQEIASIKEDVYDGTEGLAYKISDWGDHYICTGLGTVPQNSDIEIAGYYGGLPVTEIGEGAFNNVPIKSIRIPSTIKVFEYNAFGWSGLVGAVYVKDLAKWAMASFESSSTPVTANPTPPKVYIKGRYTTDLVIPEGVTYISRRAFMHWKQFKTLTLPNTVWLLDEMAFQYCQGLESVTIPASVERVEASSFGLCYALKSVTFEGKPKLISSATFQNDTAILDIYVPWKEGEVPNTPWGATNATVHYECYGTEGLEYTLSDDGTYYWLSGIGTATNETDVVVASVYNGLPVKKIGIPDKLISPFHPMYAPNLTTIVIPSSVIYIKNYVFEYSTLKTVIFEGKPKGIDVASFRTGIKDIYVPWSVGEVLNAPWGATNATIHYNSEV